MFFYRGVLAFFFLLGLAGCGPHSLEDFREEGEKITKVLIVELQKIHTREQLIKNGPLLQKLFNELTTLMIAAREYREKYQEVESLEFTSKNHELSEQLRKELNRLYQLEGGRELIEKYQQEALYRLDLAQKKGREYRKN
jgi:hypothetical protein